MIYGQKNYIDLVEELPDGSFEISLRYLCVLCASAVLHVVSFSFTAEAQRTQR